MSSNPRENLKNSKKSKDSHYLTIPKPKKTLHKHKPTQETTKKLKRPENSFLPQDCPEELTQCSSRDINTNCLLSSHSPTNYRAVTEQLQRKVIDSLSLFKEANSDYIKNSEYVSDQFLGFNKDLDYIQIELLKLAKEKKESLDELKKLRKILEDPKKFIRPGGFLNEEEADHYILGRLQGLKGQVSLLKARIDKSESMIEQVPSSSYKDSACLLKMQETILDSSESYTNCSTCVII